MSDNKVKKDRKYFQYIYIVVIAFLVIELFIGATAKVFFKEIITLVIVLAFKYLSNKNDIAIGIAGIIMSILLLFIGTGFDIATLLLLLIDSIGYIKYIKANDAK